MAQRMIWNQTAYFGAGAIEVIPDELARRGVTKAFVVTDRALVESGVAGRVTALLDAAGLPYDVYDDVRPNPPIEDVQAGVAAFAASGADVLVAIGGGSPQDTCKAIGIITANPEFSDVRSLEGVAPTRNPSVPIVAVPTTAGTASETTINYVITDVERQRKFVCVDPHDIPVLAVVDPQMMSTAPRALKVATGLDALTHAIEGYVTKGAWELSDLFHLKAIQVIAGSLQAAADGDAAAAERMALGQYVAGMGYSNVGLGLVHAMAHPLGAFYSAPHGVANGILLAPVMAFNAPATGEKYRDVAAAFGVEDAHTLPLEEARSAAVEAVAALTRDLGNPTRLSEVGATESDVAALAKAAFEDVCAGGNPREASVADIEALYRSLL
ncbi:lactaldehyde reductase [Cellulomonas fimi]|uniref:Lactaldehyde reductase n=1 Tax=Cellulomonas fimi (strain ATCC 484 / DSM 20113 / JCM 1341 / CCUG 24087 / LMG 16345 / NBRC 15513 / NCIMB 8980 / NCTC 7547 / NRS-133) TaxID=590998 RepID=F4GYV3_CELFA|nr:lactaldehyde reductase [Cellulomonas fimi]AEE44822.1 lactaldehyde reductase [Cellulomonas fimi ATCC 484]NNH08363.1 lactaldehyde reductase [Cellulomonas fimi]VEH27391.1 Lactaldehyde reductase [Cellulomonas fimi]